MSGYSDGSRGRPRCGGRGGSSRGEVVGQASMAEREVHGVVGFLARELVGGLRESMIILRAEEAARAIVGEIGTSSLAKEFFKSNPMEFHGSVNPLLEDEWLDQTVKTFEVYHIVDDEL